MHGNVDLAPPKGTRAALIFAGLELFGRDGFAATSTRALAERADTNIASIAYHFGGKDGLYQACGVEVVRRMQSVLGQPETLADGTAQAAQAKLEIIVRNLTMFLNSSHQADDLVAFLLREMASGGPALQAIYETMIEPKHREICSLWAVLSGGEAQSDAVKLAVFAFLGQILYFRIGREVVNRRMGWGDGSPENAAKIADTLVGNLRKLLNIGDLK